MEHALGVTPSSLRQSSISSVLILIVMEHALGVNMNKTMASYKTVLILIVMEHALGAKADVAKVEEIIES